MSKETTISQALRRAAKVKGELKEALERAQAGLNHAADAQPAFTFTSQLEEAGRLRAELIKLETGIRLANSRTSVTFEGRAVTLVEATALMREMRSHIAWLRGLACAAQADTYAESVEWDDTMEHRHKVKKVMKCAMPEGARAEAVKKEQARFDALNDLVENKNHTTAIE